ncbi:MAG: methyl-accepting chemotaxis protein [Marinobacter sp.]|nr:methyl-accepting chemotaxis protein [Marinobacter sp.]
MVSIGSILLFAPFLVLVLFLTSRALVSQLNRVVELLSRVSEGDLTKKLSLGNNPNDEFNTLGKATNQMIDKHRRADERVHRRHAGSDRGSSRA